MDNEVVLELSSEIYNEVCLDESIRVFNESLDEGEIRLEINEVSGASSRFKISFPMTEYGLDLAYEFGNYVLILMKNKTIV